MIDPDDAPSQNLFSLFKEGGWWESPVLVLLLGIGILHFSLCVRSIAGRSSYPPVIHAILLFSGPVLVALSICALLPSVLFVEGIDADDVSRQMLKVFAFSGRLSLVIFVCNLLLSLVAIYRGQRGIGRTER